MVVEERGRYYLLGVVSYGKLCGGNGSPGVFTRVTEYLKWIEDKTGNPGKFSTKLLFRECSYLHLISLLKVEVYLRPREHL